MTFRTDVSRRGFLGKTAALTAAGATTALLSVHGFALESKDQVPQPNDIIDRFRSLAAKTPIQTTPLAGDSYLLQGVGGNMVVFSGTDGKVLIDSSVNTAAPLLKQALAALGDTPVQLLLNTHWHFDHTDGNAPLHEGGASVIAHTSTLRHLASPEQIEAIGASFPAAPKAGWPEQTFAKSFELKLNKTSLQLEYFGPAHTDSDIYVFAPEKNILHVGDIWFNGFYPLIDYTNGGKLEGMIAGAERSLALANATTKIVPGHGPLGDKAGLQQFRDMLATVRDRVGALKSSGKSLAEIIAAKPTSDLDAKWSGGTFKGDQFTAVAYKSL